MQINCTKEKSVVPAFPDLDEMLEYLDIINTDNLPRRLKTQSLMGAFGVTIMEANQVVAYWEALPKKEKKMTEEQEFAGYSSWRGVTVGEYTIAFFQVQYIQVEKDNSLSVLFNGRYLMLEGQDAENFYKAYRAYLGYGYPETDEDEEVPF